MKPMRVYNPMKTDIWFVDDDHARNFARIRSWDKERHGWPAVAYILASDEDFMRAAKAEAVDGHLDWEYVIRKGAVNASDEALLHWVASFYLGITWDHEENDPFTVARMMNGRNRLILHQALWLYLGLDRMDIWLDHSMKTEPPWQTELMRRQRQYGHTD